MKAPRLQKEEYFCCHLYVKSNILPATSRDMFPKLQGYRQPSSYLKQLKPSYGYFKKVHENKELRDKLTLVQRILKSHLIFSLISISMKLGKAEWWRKREWDLGSVRLVFKMTTMTRADQVEARSLPLLLGLMHGWQRSKHLAHLPLPS